MLTKSPSRSFRTGLWRASVSGAALILFALAASAGGARAQEAPPGLTGDWIVEYDSRASRAPLPGRALRIDGESGAWTARFDGGATCPSGSQSLPYYLAIQGGPETFEGTIALCPSAGYIELCGDDAAYTTSFSATLTEEGLLEGRYTTEGVFKEGDGPCKPDARYDSDETFRLAPACDALEDLLDEDTPEIPAALWGSDFPVSCCLSAAESLRERLQKLEEERGYLRHAEWTRRLRALRSAHTFLVTSCTVNVGPSPNPGAYVELPPPPRNPFTCPGAWSHLVPVWGNMMDFLEHLGTGAGGYLGCQILDPVGSAMVWPLSALSEGNMKSWHDYRDAIRECKRAMGRLMVCRLEH